MTAINFPGTTRTDPPANAEPSPREPVSARAMIASTAEARRRELVTEIRATSEKLKRLLNEEVQLRAHLELSGIVTEEAE